MDYVKEVEEWDKQTKRGGGWVRKEPSEDVNTEERARATARIELKNGRTTERRRRTNGEGDNRRNGRVLLGVERGE